MNKKIILSLIPILLLCGCRNSGGGSTGISVSSGPTSIISSSATTAPSQTSTTNSSLTTQQIVLKKASLIVSGQCFGDSFDDGTALVGESQQKNNEKFINYCNGYAPGLIKSVTGTSVYSNTHLSGNSSCMHLKVGEKSGSGFGSMTVTTNCMILSIKIIAQAYYKEYTDYTGQQNYSVDVGASIKVEDQIKTLDCEEGKPSNTYEISKKFDAQNYSFTISSNTQYKRVFINSIEIEYLKEVSN